MMFEKFNPAAWIESEKWRSSPAKVAEPANVVAGDPETLATVATLAASNRQSQNFAEAEPAIPAATPDVAVELPIPHLPALVQAVLDRWPGSVIVAVRRSLDGTARTFPPAPGFWTDPPLSYAEGSAASTAALGPPGSRTRWVVERERCEDFGSLDPVDNGGVQ
jgi:hypothetical protein